MKIDTLEPEFKMKIQELLDRLKTMGINCVVTSARRTIKDQDKLFEQGRIKAGKIVTNAKGGQSPHNFGLAADLCPLNKNGKLWWNAPDDVWNAMHMVGEEVGLRAGYDFKSIKDAPHFEDMNWKEVQAQWKEGKITIA